jgi:PAS domain S-box-containing protein
MSSRSTRWTLRYGVAVLAVEITVALLFIPQIGQGLASLTFLAVLISAWYGGLGPGLLATLLVAAVAVAMPLVLRTGLPPWRVVGVVLFVAGGALVTVLVEALHAARRRAEASQAWLSAVLTSIGDAVIATDGRGHVNFLNPVARGLTGWDPGEATGRPLDEVFHIISELDRAPVNNPVARVLREGTIVGLGNHTTLIARDGVERPIDDSAAPIRDEAGTVSGAVLVFRDVTERRRAEEALRSAKDEAEASSRAKDQFLAALSHELRTPLTPVLVGVSALLDDPETPAAVRPALEVARRNVELEARLIDDLLDVTRISRGKLRLGRKVVDAHPLVLQAVEICRDEIATAGLGLELDLSACGHHVEADPARLQQIVWNLVKNAAKFTPAGGAIAVRSRDAAEGEGEAGLWVLEVSDTGVGIEPGLLPRIFDAFEQGDAASAPQFGGLGLGLTIGRTLAEAHGGRLSAASAGPGAGATFTLELPTVAAPTPEPSQSPPAPPNVPPAPVPRVLLVDDNPDTLRMIARLLQRRGYPVTTADDLASARRAAGSGEFDLLVSDIGLPDGTGHDLMRELRGRGSIRGIAISGYGREDDLRRSLEAGFAAHLTKPIDFQELEDAIRRAVAPAGV